MMRKRTNNPGLDLTEDQSTSAETDVVMHVRPVEEQSSSPQAEEKSPSLPEIKKDETSSRLQALDLPGHQRPSTPKKEQVMHAGYRHSALNLDLGEGQRPAFSKEKNIMHLVRSLRENYFSYGFMMAEMANKKLEDKAQEDKQNSATSPEFFALPRVPLPPMKPNSSYAVWNGFVDQVVSFLDEKNQEQYILELIKLEKLFSSIRKNTPASISDETILENILSEFEKNAGFSDVVDIKPTDGPGGILTPEQFNNLLIQGNPINDLGTTFQLEQHGKYSHRLQFYLLGKRFIENPLLFFKQEELNTLIDQLTSTYPNEAKPGEKFPVNKIISVFYRMLGTEEFKNCFDWKTFIAERRKKDLYHNNKPVPPHLNRGSMWVQLFDRYGWAGYGSVPSTFGFLQKLGCFPNLPKIGEPKTKTNSHLKTILDVTRPLQPDSKNKPTENTAHGNKRSLVEQDFGNESSSPENLENSNHDNNKKMRLGESSSKRELSSSEDSENGGKKRRLGH